MATPTIRREQVAGMNIHYINYSLDYFLDAQQRAGFKTIELWCAAPHVWLDHLAYFDAKEIAQKIRARDLTVQVLTPENCTYPYQFAAKEPEHVERSFGYFSNGIRLAQELGYFDQAHFIHDFRAVCGVTPGAYRAGLSDFYNEPLKF